MRSSGKDIDIKLSRPYILLNAAFIGLCISNLYNMVHTGAWESRKCLILMYVEPSLKSA